MLLIHREAAYDVSWPRTLTLRQNACHVYYWANTFAVIETENERLRDKVVPSTWKESV